MFNVGGGEILVILLVALVVLGPDKLPGAMRSVGNMVGEVRKLSNGFQAEVRSAMYTDNQPPAQDPTTQAPTTLDPTAPDHIAQGPAGHTPTPGAAVTPTSSNPTSSNPTSSNPTSPPPADDRPTG